MAKGDSACPTASGTSGSCGPSDFGPITEGFHIGSLTSFSYRLAKGLSVDAERIAAIKVRNPSWREHEAFRTYCEDFENGRIRRKPGRPRQSRSDLYYMIASLEYGIYLRLLRRWRRRGTRNSMLARHYADPNLVLLDDCHAAATIVRDKLCLGYSAGRLLDKMSAERHGR